MVMKESALVGVAEDGDLVLVVKLLEQGVDVDAENRYRM